MTTLPRFMLDPFPPVLPAGMRASAWAKCPAQAFIAQFDPDRYFSFHPGIGQAGHDVADLFIDRVLGSGGASVEAEVPVPWAHGSSHIDAVVRTGDYAGCWELKSTSKDPRVERVAPSAENVRQVKLQAWLALEAGMDLPAPFRIVVVSKRDWSIHGPVEVAPTAEDAADFARELALIDGWMNRADTIDLDHDEELRDACLCSVCFTPERVWVEKLESILDFKWHELVTVPRVLADWKPIEARLKELRADVKEALEAAGETHAECGFYTATLSKAGVVTVRPKKELRAA